MLSIITVVHVVVALVLIVVVLLQTGKGASMGAVFGGGSSHTLFGNRGAFNFMNKMTTAAAIIFMLTSLGISILRARQSVSTITPPTSSLETSAKEETAPVAILPESEIPPEEAVPAEVAETAPVASEEKVVEEAAPAAVK